MRESLRGFLAAGILIGGCGLVMAFFQRPDSPAFVLSLCSAIIGGLLVAAVIAVIRLTRE